MVCLERLRAQTFPDPKTGEYPVAAHPAVQSIRTLAGPRSAVNASIRPCALKNIYTIHRFRQSILIYLFIYTLSARTIDVQLNFKKNQMHCVRPRPEIYFPNSNRKLHLQLLLHVSFVIAKICISITKNILVGAINHGNMLSSTEHLSCQLSLVCSESSIGTHDQLRIYIVALEN